MKPLFKHNCPNCTFLGTKNNLDYYKCSDDEESIIARRSSNVGDYSTIPSIVMNHSMNNGDFEGLPQRWLSAMDLLKRASSSSNREARWSRINEISPVDKDRLDRITKGTKGMSTYGNRARTSVMLPLELAETIANRSKLENKTVSEIIVSILEVML